MQNRKQAHSWHRENKGLSSELLLMCSSPALLLSQTFMRLVLALPLLLVSSINIDLPILL